MFSERAFFGALTLLFAASAAVTIVWCGGSLSPMGGSAMAWMPMCGQTWAAAAASFLGMWVVMTVAMMLPSLTPMLWRYVSVSAAPRCKSVIGCFGFDRPEVPG
jgi:predicted metal-binding membrane protein